MKINILCVLVISFLANPVFSKNNFYLELLGNGTLYSLNYERILLDNIGIRVGYCNWFWPGAGPWADEYMWVFPINVNYLLGKSNHHLEAGAGPSFVIGKIEMDIFGGSTTASGIKLFYSATLGYRYHNNANGFLLRAGFTPLYFPGSPGQDFLPSLGISIGYGR